MRVPSEYGLPKPLPEKNCELCSTSPTMFWEVKVVSLAFHSDELHALCTYRLKVTRAICAQVILCSPRVGHGTITRTAAISP